MSVVTLQVGQCGNQVGKSIFTQLVSSIEGGGEEEGSRTEEMYFRRGRKGKSKRVARAVMIDMEPKVVERAVGEARREGKFEYNGTSLQKQEGSANNWAYGYSVQSLCSMEGIVEDIQKEVETVDSLNGFMMVHSVAGGTGSGVGSHLSEVLSDLYCGVPLATASVLPLQTGEITTQHYNCLLTLAHLQRYSDVSVLMDNTRLLKHFEKQQQGGGKNNNGPKTMAEGFEGINQQMAWEVCGGVLLPGKMGGRRMRLLHDFVDVTVPTVDRKFVTLYTTQQPDGGQPSSWNVELRQLSRQAGVATGRTGAEPPPSLLSLRGHIEKPAQGLSKVEVSTPSSLFGPNCQTLTGVALDVRGVTHGSGFLASNSPAVTGLLDKIRGRAFEMVSCGAYLHHFQKYGVEKDDCLTALDTLKQVVKDYEG